MAPVPRASDGAAVTAAIGEHGCVVVEGVLDADERGELAAAVGALEAGRPLGRNVFEGERSHRLYSLIARGRVFEDLAEHPLIVDVLDRLLQPNWLLSN